MTKPGVEEKITRHRAGSAQGAPLHVSLPGPTSCMLAFIRLSYILRLIEGTIPVP
jgi:hypothetical protein